MRACVCVRARAHFWPSEAGIQVAQCCKWLVWLFGKKLANTGLLPGKEEKGPLVSGMSKKGWRRWGPISDMSEAVAAGAALDTDVYFLGQARDKEDCQSPSRTPQLSQG